MTTQPFDIRASRRTEGGKALGGAIRVLAVTANAPGRLDLGGLLEVQAGVEQAVTAVSARKARGGAARIAPDVVAAQGRREGAVDPFSGRVAVRRPARAQTLVEPLARCC
jgi:hypothetical protein